MKLTKIKHNKGFNLFQRVWALRPEIDFLETLSQNAGQTPRAELVARIAKSGQKLAAS